MKYDYEKINKKKADYKLSFHFYVYYSLYHALKSFNSSKRHYRLLKKEKPSTISITDG